MNKVKSFLIRHSAALTAFALAMSFTGGFGNHCRTWFYQPEVPQSD